jgi:hypothetical protein
MKYASENSHKILHQLNMVGIIFDPILEEAGFDDVYYGNISIPQDEDGILVSMEFESGGKKYKAIVTEFHPTKGAESRIEEIK